MKDKTKIMRRYYYVTFRFSDSKEKWEKYTDGDLARERAIELLQEGVVYINFKYE